MRTQASLARMLILVFMKQPNIQTKPRSKNGCARAKYLLILIPSIEDAADAPQLVRVVGCSTSTPMFGVN